MRKQQSYRKQIFTNLTDKTALLITISHASIAYDKEIFQTADISSFMY